MEFSRRLEISHSGRRISNLWAPLLSRGDAIDLSFQFSGGTQRQRLRGRSPGCFHGHLRPVSAQGCNLDWQWIAYNQPKKLFWKDQWGDVWVKPDEFTDWGKATSFALFLLFLIGADGNVFFLQQQQQHQIATAETQTNHQTALCSLFIRFTSANWQ